MIAVSVITLADDLQRLVDEINHSAWDDENDIAEHEVNALIAYLERQDTVFVCCHDITEHGRTLLGIASGRFEVKPYPGDHWLYVDEVDVCQDQRCKGAGKAIMLKLIALAKEANCEVVWLGTEIDNHAANALYHSIKPDEVMQFVGYTYELED